jgi:hypothetical protein
LVVDYKVIHITIKIGLLLSLSMRFEQQNFVSNNKVVFLKNKKEIEDDSFP